MKRIIAALLAGLCLFALVGCSAGSKADSAAPKDYSQIIHDARTDEDNEYDMIFTRGEDGKFTAIDGYSAEYEADQLNDELKDIVFPLLGLEDGSYESFAASVSSMMVRSYAIAIVKPAEGKTDAVKAALEAYVQSEQQSMEHYLEDQYQVAKAATVTVAPTGEVILVCAEDHDTILSNIEKALARIPSSRSTPRLSRASGLSWWTTAPPTKVWSRPAAIAAAKISPSSKTAPTPAFPTR